MSDAFAKRLGVTLKALRVAQGLSQIEMAAACSTSNQNLSKIERGFTLNVNMEILVKAAIALQTPLYKVIAQADEVNLEGIDGLNKQEKDLIERFRAASDEQRAVIELMSTLSGR